MRHRHTHRGGDRRPATFTTCIATGLFSSLLLLLSCLVLIAALAYRSQDPGAYLAPGSYLAVCLSAFLCGMIAARRYGKSGLLCGLAAGGGWICLLLLGLCLFSGPELPTAGRMLLFYLILFTLCTLGGLWGGRRRTTRRRRHSPAH